MTPPTPRTWRTCSSRSHEARLRIAMGPSMGSAPAYKRAFEVQADRSEVPHGNAQRQQRRRGEMERAGLVPRLRHPVLAASAVVAAVAGGGSPDFLGHGPTR